MDKKKLSILYSKLLCQIVNSFLDIPYIFGSVITSHANVPRDPVPPSIHFNLISLLFSELEQLYLSVTVKSV